MKFGIFYELQCPRPWEQFTERDLYQNALAQVELADKLGYHYAWEVEHHFLEEYSHSPQPEVFLAAASQRTKNIRLGHGIIQLTTNHPARVAEKVACLDLVSNGRVEFGMGEGASITELGPFDRPMEEKQAIWEDGVRCVLPMFKDGGWEYDGPYFKFPLRNVLPKPMQKPHPPLWVACSQLETIELAGRCGIGALGLPVPQRGNGACLGACLLQQLHKTAAETGRLPEQLQHRHGQLFHVRRDRRGSAPPRRWRDVLPVLAGVVQRIAQPRAAAARNGEPVGRIREMEAGQSGTGA